jgi:serine/threonine protein kinase
MVRQCVHLPTGDICAVKMISTKFIAYEGALHEYTLISSIRHQSIVRVFHIIEMHAFSIIVCQL